MLWSLLVSRDERERERLLFHVYSMLSPGGVGFDINCGVRLVRTNLFEKDVQPIKEQLAQVTSCYLTYVPAVTIKWIVFSFCCP